MTISPGGALRYLFAGGPISLPVVNVATLVLSERDVDPDLSNNRSIAMLGPPVRLLFRDDFESGDLSAWSDQDASGLAVTHEASLQGDFGLDVAPADGASATVVDDSPEAETDYHADFLMDPTAFLQDGDEGAILFSGKGASPTPSLFEVRLLSQSGALFLRARAALDDGSVVETASLPITAARHLLEVAWRRASAPAASDGQLQIRLDGEDAALLGSLDNDAGGGVEAVTLGLVPLGPSPGWPHGTIRLDGFESWAPEIP
jgi:hypothetical protein